jgi:hypothetical protein
MGYLCPDCKQYIYRGNALRTKDEIKKKHICHMRQCYVCGEVKESKMHQCYMKQEKLPKKPPNVAFLSITYSGGTAFCCKECFQQKASCKFCSDNIFDSLNPLMCVLFIERGQRGSFDRYVFATYGHENGLISHDKNYFQQMYMPKGYEHIPLPTGGSTTRFNQSRRRKISSKTFLNNQESPIDCLLHFFLQENIANLSIICDGRQRDLEHIMIRLSQKKFQPRVMQKNQTILMVSVNELDIKFVAMDNFAFKSFSMQKLAKDFGLQLNAFPRRILKESFFSYCGKVPEKENFFCFDDTAEDIEEKKRTICDLPIPWSLKKNLIIYTTQKTRIVASCCLQLYGDLLQTQLSSVLYEPSFSGTGRSPWVYRPRSSSLWLGAQVAITYFRSAYTRFAHLYSCHSPFRGRRSCLCPSIPPTRRRRAAFKENGQQPCCLLLQALPPATRQKQFIRNEYNHPPPYRLDGRASGKVIP